MDNNTTTGENQDKIISGVESNNPQETFTISKEEWERVTGKLYNLDRVTKKLGEDKGAVSLDKDTLKSIEELAEAKRINDFAQENNIPPSLVKQLYTLKPNINKDDLENPLIKNMVKEYSRNQRVEMNTPSGTGTSGRTTKEFKDLKSDEKQAWFEQKMRL